MGAGRSPERLHRVLGRFADASKHRGRDPRGRRPRPPLAFYRDGLGLASSGIIAAELHDEVSGADGAIAMFELDGGLVLSLYPRTDLANDAGIEVASTSRGEFRLGNLVEHREEVDAVLARGQAAGARLTGGPRERPWGICSGYFEDPDGHLWEVIRNPEAPGGEAT